MYRVGFFAAEDVVGAIADRNLIARVGARIGHGQRGEAPVGCDLSTGCVLAGRGDHPAGVDLNRSIVAKYNFVAIADLNDVAATIAAEDDIVAVPNSDIIVSFQPGNRIRIDAVYVDRSAEAAFGLPVGNIVDRA